MPATELPPAETPVETVWKIVVNVPLWGQFDYRPADGTSVSPADIGKRVRVPFGRGGHERIGLITAIGPAGVEQVLPATLLDTEAPLLPGELLESLVWLHRYTVSPLGETVWQALPKPMRDGDPATLEPVAMLTTTGDPATLRAGKYKSALESLLTQGVLPESEARERHTGAVVNELLRRDLVRLEPVSISERLALADAAGRRWRDEPEHPLHRLQLTRQQHDAVHAIAADPDAYHGWLLEGVTGSGKTEVYLRLIAQTLAAGRQALILVPEIGLTPQTLQRFEQRLGVPVDAYHSGLSDKDRAQVWLRARAGLARVIVGTRSAAFLPLPNPGLFIVDEEHDGSFKQFDGIRYNARDFLVQRGHRVGRPIVLGSATPSLESLHNAQSGRYGLLRLTERAHGGATHPQMHIVDMRGVPLEAGLSPVVLKAIQVHLERGEQVLVFRNRRGYAPVLLCHDCGWSAQCQQCDAPMTVHRQGRRLQCHHCGASCTAPPACPDCGGLALHPQGIGTERLEEFLSERFADLAPVVRIDRGSTRTRDGLQQRLASVGDGAGLLIGTQMLAKGHDLPNLTLVVVVGADEGLFSTDFRAGERLAQQLIQVAGRAGRADKPGVVLIQTHHPDHLLLQRLLAADYDAVAQTELAERSKASWPPFAALALIRAEGRHVADVREFLQSVANAFGPYPNVMVMGPLPAPMPKRAGYLREQLLLQTDSRADLHYALQRVIPTAYGAPLARKVRWSLDVDPYDLY